MSSFGEPIVITGIGMITSVGNDRESVWKAVRDGHSGARRLEGLEASRRVGQAGAASRVKMGSRACDRGRHRSADGRVSAG